MATGIPASSTFTGLAQKVIAYGEAFEHVIAALKQGEAGEGDWAGLEALVDATAFERVGMFLTAEVETIDWPTYKHYVSEYGHMTHWDGKLRRITESGNVVFQELEERNTRAIDGKPMASISNTVTVFEFNSAGRIVHLDVYVAHLRDQPA